MMPPDFGFSRVIRVAAPQRIVVADAVRVMADVSRVGLIAPGPSAVTPMETPCACADRRGLPRGSWKSFRRYQHLFSFISLLSSCWLARDRAAPAVDLPAGVLRQFGDEADHARIRDG